MVYRATGNDTMLNVLWRLDPRRSAACCHNKSTSETSSEFYVYVRCLVANI